MLLAKGDVIVIVCWVLFGESHCILPLCAHFLSHPLPPHLLPFTLHSIKIFALQHLFPLFPSIFPRISTIHTPSQDLIERWKCAKYELIFHNIPKTFSHAKPHANPIETSTSNICRLYCDQGWKFFNLFSHFSFKHFLRHSNYNAAPFLANKQHNLVAFSHFNWLLMTQHYAVRLPVAILGNV